MVPAELLGFFIEHFYMLDKKYRDQTDFTRFNVRQVSRATFKIRKTARIRNRYKQPPHLSKNTKWENNKITINITNKSQEVSPFPIGDQKAAMNRRKSMTNTRQK